MRTRHTLRSLALLLLLPAGAHAQGTLTPPAAPAPSMKTLDQLNTQLLATDAKTEARTPVDLLGGDATARFIIGQPGSYYLRGSIIVASAGQSGIRVTAPNVTIDLNGFLVGGPGAAASTVAGITSSGNGTVVRNGRLSGWATGVSLAADGTAADLNVRDCGNVGVSLTGPASFARNIVVNGAGNVGIVAGIVESCVVSNILGGTGEKVGIDASIARGSHVSTVTALGASDEAYGIRAQTIQHCRVAGITSGSRGFGVYAPDLAAGVVSHTSVLSVSGTPFTYGVYSGVIADSTVRQVSGTVASVYGIRGTVVRDCISNEISATSGGGAVGISGDVVNSCEASNIEGQDHSATGIIGTRVTNCVVSTITVSVPEGLAYGLNLSSGSSATGNTVSSAGTYGIRATNNCTVANNSISGVGGGAGITEGAHIRVAGTDNRIENNTVTGAASADYGIRVTGTRNFVAGNRATGTFTGVATGAGGVDGPEFNIAVGNRFGPIVSTFAATGEITATNPYANFSD